MKTIHSLSCLVVLTLTLLVSTKALADSPITSTFFHEAYTTEVVPNKNPFARLAKESPVPIVVRAKESGELDDEMALFLSEPDNPIDVKAALVNALGWSIAMDDAGHLAKGKDNSDRYLRYLAKRYALSEEDLTATYATVLSADEIFAYGYLLVMDDYGHPENALPFIEVARKMNPTSYTVAIVTALVRAQRPISFCQMWIEVEEVLRDPAIEGDMRGEASNIILDYMLLYEDACYRGRSQRVSTDLLMKLKNVVEESELKATEPASLAQGHHWIYLFLLANFVLTLVVLKRRRG